MGRRARGGISKAEARRIAGDLVTEEVVYTGHGPSLRNHRDLSDCWIVRVHGPSNQLVSSQIIAVSKKTGEVIYAGSAHNEG